MAVICGGRKSHVSDQIILHLFQPHQADVFTFGIGRKEAAQLSLSGRKLRCVGTEQVACFGIEDNGSAACQRQLGSHVFRNQKLTLAL